MKKNLGLSVGVGRLRTKLNGDMRAVKRGVMIKLFGAVIKDTPVGTSNPKRGYTGGRLRGNWTFTKGTPEKVRRVGFDDPTARVNLAINKDVTEADETCYLTNNMPYAGRIEYDGWSHTKAPEGMVRRNLVRVASLLRKQAAKIAKEGGA